MFNKKEKTKINIIKNKKVYTEKQKATRFTIIAIISIIIFSAAICPVTLQNDTYYTIKVGEHIVNEGIDMQDPFSWHEGLPYTYPHWAYDVIIYLIYNFAGFIGIFISTIVLSCILGILIYITNCKISKNRLISFVLTIGIMYLLKNFIAARAQLVTFILLELTILFIENFLQTKKKRYLIGLIIISIAIANLHCAVWPFFFVLFLPYIAEYIIFMIIDKNIIFDIRKLFYKIKLKKYQNEKNKIKNNLEKNDKLEKNEENINKIILKIDELNVNKEKVIQNREKKRKNPYKIKYEKNKAAKYLILIMFICILTGFLTPLGKVPYTYLEKTMEGNTTENISEHLPLTLINNKEILIVITAIIALLIFTDTKIRLKDLFMLAGLALLMFMTRRQESMFLIFGGGVVVKLVTDIFMKYDKKGLEEYEKIFVSGLGGTIIILLIILISLIQVKPKLNNKFINESSYPVKAADWIKENLDVTQIKLFNEYNYGSYLLFKEIPVFIDSRCDLYTPEFNGTKQEDGKYEGRDIFSDYINTSSISKYYESTFEKYDITHVITVSNSKLNMLISKDESYTQIYSDEKFVIYERNV